MLLSAGVHGDEYEPILAAIELQEKVPPVLQKGKVVIVPIVNESAHRLGSRCGEDGRDLARVCPGSPTGTATEVAAHGISELIRKSDYYADMHTGGLAYELAPLAGYLLHPSEGILEKQRGMALAFNLPVVWGTDATPNGRTLSVARDAGVPAIYLEYGGGTGMRPQVVKAYRDGFLNLLKKLNMIEGSEETLPAADRYWVEDHRKDSGHLQAMMLAPADGIFVPAVSVGEPVGRGQLWGTVTDPATGRKTEVLVANDGLAFLRRAQVKVREGEALGGVLPVTRPGKKVIFDS